MLIFEELHLVNYELGIQAQNDKVENRMELGNWMIYFGLLYIFNPYSYQKIQV